MNVTELKKYVPRPDGRENVLAANAKNNDIILSIHALAGEATADVQQLAKHFKAPTVKQTAFKIWYFLRTRAKYVRDSNERQQIRLPRRFIHDTANMANSGDCKSFSLFTISILRALGLPAYLRYAGYIPGKQQPSHVYAYTKDAAGREIIIDGCYPYFDKQKNFTFVKNYDMTVTSLSGTETPAAEKAKRFLRALPPRERQQILKAYARRCKRLKIGKRNIGSVINGSDGSEEMVISHWESPIAKKLTAEQKAARKKKVKKGAKKFGWGVAFVNLIPIRAAFTAIVACNFNAIAHNLKSVYENRTGKTKKEWAKIEKIWYNLGGLKKALMKAIQLGAAHKPLFLSKKAKARFNKRTQGIKGIDTIEAIGVAPAVIAAAVAMAGGVLAAMIPALMSGLKKSGKNGEAAQVQEQGQEMVREYKAQGAPAPAPSSEYNESEGEEVDGIPEFGLPKQKSALDNAYNYSVANPGAAFDAGSTQVLFDTLSKVAAVGIQTAGQAVAKKAANNPKLAKVLNTAGQGAEDYFTGQYLRQAGYTGAAKKFTKGLTTKNILMYGGLAVAALLGIFFVTKKSK
jgi:type II secretory pathway pseudopilin PulG